MDGSTIFSQSIFKYYISVSNQDGVMTGLIMSNINPNDGTKISQTYLISNTYEFIDADGTFCLLKQTDGGGNVLFTLYMFNPN
jgi:hypothetical protein